MSAAGEESVLQVEQQPNGTLSTTVEQPAQTRGFPTWAIILIAILGAASVLSVLGYMMHRGGKKVRAARARRGLMEHERLFQ
uniref:Uncharacterized protein n=1 Tax=viral metagenome TaxID=1070528 RepID=A0A6C0BPB6_9ZZZZ